MIRLLRSLWIWLACATLIMGWVPLLAAIRLTDRTPLHRRTGAWFRRLGRMLARVNPWRLILHGAANLDPARTYVIVSNHQSLADIPLLSHLPTDTKWLAKAELFRIPLVGWMLRMAGDVAVQRDDRRQAAQALLHCAKILRAGCSVVFFPEGTRSPEGEVLPFNDGPFQLAIREGVPVLPIAVEGTGAALPKHALLFGGGYDIHLSLLSPVPVDGLTVKLTAELRERVRGMIVDEVARLRGVRGR